MNYIDIIPTAPRYQYDAIPSFETLLRRGAVEYGNAPALHSDDALMKASVSYRELYERVCGLAAVLGERFSGRSIMLAGANSALWLIAYFAVVLSGNTVVPCDRELTAAGFDELAGKCSAAAMICSAAQLETGACARSVPCLSLEELVRDSASRTRFQADNAPDRPAVMIYTSGTTGLSKLIMLSQRNICADACSGVRMVSNRGRTITVLPYHHMFAMFSVFAALCRGSEIYICSSMREFFPMLRTCKPTYLYLVPAIIRHLFSLLERDGDADAVTGGCLAFIISGGAPLSEDYVRGFLRFGIHIFNGYGMTEVAPAATLNHFDSEDEFKPESVGRPLPGVEMRLEEPDESGCGEVCIHGPMVMLGYYNDPEATASVLKDGWLHTGDLGRTDGKGRLLLVGRKKNLIILENGKNVSPEELEELVGGIAGVRETRVSESGGQIIAEIYPDDEFITGAKAAGAYEYFLSKIDALNAALPPYKAMTDVRLRDSEFPKTALNKLIREGKRF